MFYDCHHYRLVKVVPDVVSVEGKWLPISVPSVNFLPVWTKIHIIVKNVEYAGKSRKCDVFLVRLAFIYLFMKVSMMLYADFCLSSCLKQCNNSMKGELDDTKFCYQLIITITKFVVI